MILNLKMVETISGEPTLKAMLHDGRNVYLHSRIDPVEEANRWAATVKIQENTAYIVMGFGLGYHIKSLLKRLPERSFIYVIDVMLQEQCYQKLFDKQQRQFEWLHSDDRLQIFGKQEVFIIATSLNKEMQKKNINQVKLCCYYPALNLQRHSYHDYLNNLIKEAEKLRYADLSFALYAGQKMFDNAWRNFSSILSQHGIAVLSDSFNGIPAVIVSAGPSLNRNIGQIKKYKDRVVLIASGTAIGALRKEGIIPHFLVVIDPFDINGDILAEYVHEKTILVAPYDAPPKLIASHKGKICYYKKPLRATEEHVFGGIEKLLPETDFLLGHISVAVTAFFLAEKMGANPVIFTGQDLAFPARALEGQGEGQLGNTHAAGVKAGVYDPEVLRSRKCVVEGFYGEKVFSTQEFKMVIDFFSVVFGARKSKKIIINATEGGAYLPNAMHLPFEQVAHQYFTKNIDVQSLIDDCFLVNRCHPDTYQNLLAIFEGLLSQINNTFQAITRLKIEFIQKAEGFPIRYEREIEFCDKVKSLVSAIRESDMFVFIKVYFSVILDLFELEEQEEGNIAEKVKHCINILRGLEDCLKVFAGHLSMKTNELTSKLKADF